MVIQEFGCTGFRNYSQLHLKFSAKINLFFGKNGQGKSNLAEGIYFLSHLDSFRTHRFNNLIQFDTPISYIQALILKNSFSQKTKIELTKRGRKVWLNESQINKLSQYVTEFYATVFNPDHLHSYRHYPQERRNYFDRFVSFYDRTYLKIIREFRTVLSQKNQLLKNKENSSLLAWNTLFADKSYAIIQKRRGVVEAINKILPGLHDRLTGRGQKLLLHYRPSLEGDPSGWPTLLAGAAEKEMRAGHALIGPHRDDFRLATTEGAQDEYFSQGEYRISMLAVKLAVTALIEKEMAFSPVLILDDLFSELDTVVKENLRQYLFAVSNQVFITSTERLRGFTDSAVRIMEIQGGRIV